jgi:hypothetical protein
LFFDRSLTFLQVLIIIPKPRLLLVGMNISVITYYVPLFQDAFEKVRCSFNTDSGDKKDSASFVGPEAIEDIRGYFRMGPVIECEQNTVRSALIEPPSEDTVRQHVLNYFTK